MPICTKEERRVMMEVEWGMWDVGCGMWDGSGDFCCLADGIFGIGYFWLWIFIILARTWLMRFVDVFLLFLMVFICMAKRLTKDVNLGSLLIEPGTIFLTKFDIGADGHFTIHYRKHSNQGDFKNSSLMLGLLQDDNYHKFRSVQTCPLKSQLYSQSQPITFLDKSWGSTTFKIQNQPRQHIWYLYIYACQPQTPTSTPTNPSPSPHSDRPKTQLIGSIQLQIIMMNGNSYFGQDENLLPGYAALVGIWVLLMLKMFIPVVRSVYEASLSWQQIFIYGGFLVLGLGYFYKLVDLILVYRQGLDTWYLHYFYKIIKYTVQGILVTVITSIGWGWFLTHSRHQPYHIIVGTIVTIINFLATILQTSLTELEQSHHQYESVLGFVLFLLRVIIVGVFGWGVLRCMADSVGKRRHFLRKFGGYGAGYLLAWPVGVIVAELFLPNYMHNQFVTLVEEATHIIICAYMCHLFAFPDSDFKKVRIKSEDQHEELPVYRIESK